ncbi:hypothetical protein [Winogradskyella forsetii]|uniref:hypothetical protein n=1 Tax=Winogradskyella forsetii TaxID=2686077 RepID=UPI0015B89F65|nr:hypothetical protein [Winogradskyella forsetii]
MSNTIIGVLTRIEDLLDRVVVFSAKNNYSYLIEATFHGSWIASESELTINLNCF